MPNSDSASNFMPEYKVLGYWDLPYSFYGHLKITRFFKNYMDFPYENKSGGNFSRKFIFIWRSHIKISENGNFQTAVKIVCQVVLTQNLHLGISLDAESEFGINFVSGSTFTTGLVLMSRTDFENRTCTQLVDFYPTW